jgi:hypothetical protein
MFLASVHCQRVLWGTEQPPPSLRFCLKTLLGPTCSSRHPRRNSFLQTRIVMRAALIYRLGIMLLAAGFPGTPSLAGDTETGGRPTNEQLIRQLSHGSLIVRDTAAATLGRRGHSALPAIEKALPRVDSEASFRLTRLAAAIALAETSRQAEPSVVTLSVTEQPLKEIARQIMVQTGNQILVPDQLTAVSLTCNQLPFWMALDKLASVTEGHLVLAEQPPGLGIATTQSAVGPAVPTAIADLIRVAVYRIDQLGPAGERGFRIVLKIAWEPRLSPLLLRLPLASIVAENEDGATLRQPSRLGVVEPLITGERCWVDLPLVLSQPPHGVTQLASLRGTVEMWLPGFQHRFRLPLPRREPSPTHELTTAKPSTCLSSMTVTLDDWWPTVTPAGQGLTLRATAQLAEPSEACESHRGWLADQIPELLSPSGEAVDAIAHRVVGRTSRGLTVETTFPLPPTSPVDGLQLSWQLPVRISRLPADFWLKNIPLDTSTAPD